MIRNRRRALARQAMNLVVRQVVTPTRFRAALPARR